MSATTWLWNEIHDFFDTDDGSLSEIHINFVDSKATALGYALLRKLAVTIYPEHKCFLSIPDGLEHPLSSVSNPADLVVSTQAEPFHVVFSGIKSKEIIIPDIGFFVFQNQIALDYRMGAVWNSAKVEAFFAILSRIVELDQQSSLSLEDGILPDAAVRFQSAWGRYRKS